MRKEPESINALSKTLLPEPLNKAIEQVAIEERQETEGPKSGAVQAADKRRKGFSPRTHKRKNKTPPTETPEKPPTNLEEAIESIKAEGWETQGYVRARDGTPVLEYRVTSEWLALKLHYRAIKWYKIAGLVAGLIAILAGLFKFR